MKDKYRLLAKNARLRGDCASAANAEHRLRIIESVEANSEIMRDAEASFAYAKLCAAISGRPVKEFLIYDYMQWFPTVFEAA